MSKIYKEDECVYCKKHGFIAAKGLCRACYQRNSKNGSPERKQKRNTCDIDGCDSFVVSHGLCDKSLRDSQQIEQY